MQVNKSSINKKTNFFQKHKLLSILAAIFLILAILGGSLATIFLSQKPTVTTPANKVAVLSSAINIRNIPTESARPAIAKPPVQINKLTIPANATDKPTVSFEITKDKKAGSNLKFNFGNFGLVTPDKIGQSTDYKSGYVEVFVNNKFFSRAYANDFFVPRLPSGKYQVRAVLLNANNQVIFDADKPVQTVKELVIE